MDRIRLIKMFAWKTPKPVLHIEVIEAHGLEGDVKDSDPYVRVWVCTKADPAVRLLFFFRDLQSFVP